METNQAVNQQTFFVSEQQVGMVYTEFLASRKHFYKTAIGPLDLTFELRKAIRDFIFAFGLNEAKRLARQAYETYRKVEDLEKHPELYFTNSWPTREAKVSKVVKRAASPPKRRKKKRSMKLVRKISAKVLEDLHNG